MLGEHFRIPLHHDTTHQQCRQSQGPGHIEWGGNELERYRQSDGAGSGWVDF